MKLDADQHNESKPSANTATCVTTLGLFPRFFVTFIAKQLAVLSLEREMYDTKSCDSFSATAIGTGYVLVVTDWSRPWRWSFA